jgi:2-isopropylmalate synthase
MSTIPSNVARLDEEAAVDATDGFIHDWNLSFTGRPRWSPKVVDETLRDGLQSTEVRDPTIEDKLELLHGMAGLGVDCAALAMPCTRPRQYEDALRLAREIADQRLTLKAYCAARTHLDDIKPIADISQRAGIAVEVALFIGSSPIRQYVEGWSLDLLERRTEEAVTFAREHGLPVLYVTEDTTRSSPEVLRRLYTTAIRCGAEQICVSDTVGHATPFGTANLVRFVVNLAAELKASVRVDWHGHDDRGLGLANCFAAWLAGAERCHGTALGVGERCGNPPIELLLVNLRLAGWIHQSLETLWGYVLSAARALDVPIPRSHPVVGADAFSTATGTHVSAISKASEKSAAFFDRIYSGVPASMVGRRQSIEIGPMSGAANVRYYLTERGVAYDQQTVDAVLDAAKRSNRILDETEVIRLARTSTVMRAAAG